MNTIYAKVQSDWNEHFIGYSALAIILSTCLGSVAVYTTSIQGNGLAQMIQVFLVVAACSAHNASILTVQKPKLVLNLLIMSLIVSLLIITFGLIA